MSSKLLAPFRTHRPAYAPHLPPVFAATNRAGSVGKTSIGYNLCVQAARRGYRVLLIDVDLQSDASYWSGWDGDELPDAVKTVHDVMLGRATLAEAIVPARTRVAPDGKTDEKGNSIEPFEVIENMYIVRGSEKMSQADTELAGSETAVFWLQEVLGTQIDEDEFDVIWIDTPASLARLSISVILAATNLFICTKPGTKEFRGVRAMIRRIDEVRERYNFFKATGVATWVAMNEGKSHESQGKFYMNRQQAGEKEFAEMLLPILKSATIVPEAYDAQEPVCFWDPRHTATATLDQMLDVMGLRPATSRELKSPETVLLPRFAANR
ncbi:ParA family protein [Kitasatospora sp. NPDC059327]|uniref:ParA family protein n=1 Tax=Kitasatospora sp. NPDC059327 TaxID=3346803 RepID=UPI0036780C5F